MIVTVPFVLSASWALWWDCDPATPFELQITDNEYRRHHRKASKLCRKGLADAVDTIWFTLPEVDRSLMIAMWLGWWSGLLTSVVHLTPAACEAKRVIASDPQLLEVEKGRVLASTYTHSFGSEREKPTSLYWELVETLQSLFFISNITQHFLYVMNFRVTQVKKNLWAHCLFRSTRVAPSSETPSPDPQSNPAQIPIDICKCSVVGAFSINALFVTITVTISVRNTTWDIRPCRSTRLERNQFPNPFIFTGYTAQPWPVRVHIAFFKTSCWTGRPVSALGLIGASTTYYQQNRTS